MTKLELLLQYLEEDADVECFCQIVSNLQTEIDELDKSEVLGYVSKSDTTYTKLHKLIEGVEKRLIV